VEYTQHGVRPLGRDKQDEISTKSAVFPKKGTEEKDSKTLGETSVRRLRTAPKKKKGEIIKQISDKGLRPPERGQKKENPGAPLTENYRGRRIGQGGYLTSFGSLKRGAHEVRKRTADERRPTYISKTRISSSYGLKEAGSGDGNRGKRGGGNFFESGQGGGIYEHQRAWGKVLRKSNARKLLTGNCSGRTGYNRKREWLRPAGGEQGKGRRSWRGSFRDNNKGGATPQVCSKKKRKRQQPPQGRLKGREEAQEQLQEEEKTNAGRFLHLKTPC